MQHVEFGLSLLFLVPGIALMAFGNLEDIRATKNSIHSTLGIELKVIATPLIPLGITFLWFGIRG